MGWLDKNPLYPFWLKGSNDEHADNLNVGVYVFQEAQIKRSEF